MTVAASEPEFVAIDDLQFDQLNPRFHGEEEGESQEDILKRLWREFAVDEIAFSIAANGFFIHEPLFAIPEPGGTGTGYVVIEGNRRLAAVRILRSREIQRRIKATDLPRITKQDRRRLDALPVIVTSRKEVWPMIGFKHVNGPQHWDSMAKAEYIAWVYRETDMALQEIAQQLGDRHDTVVRLYSGLTVLEQAESADKFQRSDRFYKRFYFSHLYTALGYRGVMDYLGTTSERLRSAEDKPVTPDKLDNLGRLCHWLFGDKPRNKPPLVRRQNPDLRDLSTTLETEAGRAALESGQGLKRSLDITKGDTRILRDALIEAKIALQTAKGRVVTGYRDAPDIRDYARDVLALARAVEEEIRQMDERPITRDSRPVHR